ncbi:uncharacterized protein FN964_000040 [Alca torda]
MGQTATREQKLQLELLQRTFTEQGFKVAPIKLVTLLLWICDYCSWFPKGWSYDLAQWLKVGEELQTGETLHLSLPEGIIVICRTVYTAIRTLHPAEQALQGVAGGAPQAPPEEPQSFEMIPPVADPQPEYAQTPNPEEHYQKQNSGGEEPEDPFDPGPINPETEPDLCPPLTPIKAMAASTPTVEEILQQQRRKSFLTLLHLRQLMDTVVKTLKDCVV